MKTVSIVVPIYNGGKYIEQCIETIKSQSYSAWEAIIINDGSNDDTQELLEIHTRGDERFNIIYQNNSGAASARKKGIIESNGDLLTFLDVDDTWESCYLSDMVENILETKADICVCSFNIVDGVSKKVKKNGNIGCYEKVEFLKKVLCHRSGWELCAKMYKADLFRNNDILSPDNIRIGEDAAVFIQLIIRSDKISVIEKPLYNYIQYFSSASHVKSEGYAMEPLMAANFIDEILRNECFYNEIKDYVDCMFLLFYSNSTRKAYIGRSNSLLNSMLKKHFRFRALFMIPLPKAIYILLSYLTRKIFDKPILR